MFCDKCGAEIPEDSDSCPICDNRLETINEGDSHGQEEQSQSEASADPEPDVKRTHISGNTIAAGAGAIIMFISLAFPWYAIRLPEYDISWDMDVSYLISDIWGTWSLWFGAALPVIAVIMLASIALLSSIYALLERKEDTYLWGRLGILSGGFVIINVIYLLFWMRNEYSEWVNIVNPGVVVVFIGAVVMALSHPGFRNRFSRK